LRIAFLNRFKGGKKKEKEKKKEGKKGEVQ